MGLSDASGLMPNIYEEVPDEYNTWDYALQLEYLRDRDLYSAALAQAPEDREFYALRADGYNEALIIYVRL